MWSGCEKKSQQGHSTVRPARDGALTSKAMSTPAAIRTVIVVCYRRIVSTTDHLRAEIFLSPPIWLACCVARPVLNPVLHCKNEVNGRRSFLFLQRTAASPSVPLGTSCGADEPDAEGEHAAREEECADAPGVEQAVEFFRRWGRDGEEECCRYESAFEKVVP
jgi:hypothetical protein